jgi:uncharacterized BrkB/YihY/UPF0761 family membrane protein
MPGRGATAAGRDAGDATRGVRGYERKTGVFQTLKRTFQEFKEDNLTDWAAALTYYGVLAIFPALVALVSIVGLLFNPQQIIRALTDVVSQLGPSSAVTVWNIAKWPVLVVIVMLMLAVLYYASPNAKVAGFKFISAGALVAVVIWIIASALFAFYVANFGSYNKTYGTLGGVIAFLVWLWITNVAVLLGAQLNAERERTRQLEAGVSGAEQQLQVEERDEAKPKQRPRTV